MYGIIAGSRFFLACLSHDGSRAPGQGAFCPLSFAHMRASRGRGTEKGLTACEGVKAADKHTFPVTARPCLADLRAMTPSDYRASQICQACLLLRIPRLYAYDFLLRSYHTAGANAADALSRILRQLRLQEWRMVGETSIRIGDLGKQEGLGSGLPLRLFGCTLCALCHLLLVLAKV